MTDIYEKRLEKLHEQMKENGVSCTLVTNSTNLFYMTGYSPKKCERLLCVLFPLDSDPVLIVPNLHAMDSEKKCWIKDQRVWKDGENLYTLVKNILCEKKLIGVPFAVDNTMEYMHCAFFFNASPSSQYIPASPLFSKLRMYKDAEEIKVMHESGALTDNAIKMLIDNILSGKSELELHNWIEYELGNKGMRQGFSNLIASGINSASVHHKSGTRIPQVGDAVYFDIGGAYNHYWSDATRSIHIGKPSEKYVDAYNKVKDAQQIALDSIRPGVVEHAMWMPLLVTI